VRLTRKHGLTDDVPEGFFSQLIHPFR